MSEHREWGMGPAESFLTWALFGLVLGSQLFTVGCSAPTEQEPDRLSTPTLKISTELGEANRAAAWAAARDWQAAGLVFDVTEASGLEANLRPGSCADLAPNAPGCAREAWGVIHLDESQLDACRWARVGNLTRCYRIDPATIIRHELGHWLGFWAHLPEGNTMQAHFDAASNYPKELTTLDVESVKGASRVWEK